MESATSDLSRVFARLLADGSIELPPLPATAAEVLSLCQQEATDAARLSAVIHRDPAIASNVLRVANAAAYAAQAPCSSLQQAVSRLGLQAITEIATAVALRARLFAGGPCAELLAALWRHSVLTAFFAKEIARQRRRNVEIAFLCGLLHDVGKALLLGGAPRVLGRDGPTLPVGHLLHAVDEQHVAAGEAVAAAWRLPAPIAETIRCHRDPAAADPRCRDVAASVALADQLAHFAAPSRLAVPPDEAGLRRHPLLEVLNLYPDELGALLAMRDRALLVTEGLR